MIRATAPAKTNSQWLWSTSIVSTVKSVEIATSIAFHAKNEKASGQDDSDRTSQLVNDDSIFEQAMDLADEVRMRKAVLMGEEIPHK